MKLKDFLKESSAVVSLDIAEDVIQAASPQAIKQLWAKNKTRSKRVNLAIHGRDLLLHVVTIPYIKDEAIQSALESRVNQYVSFAGVKIVIGWEKLGDIAEAGERKLRILLAVARRELVDSQINAVEKAGLRIETITFPCLAVLDLLKQTSLKCGPRENKLFVDLDGQQTFILFLKGGTIHFVHQGSLEGLSEDLKKILQREDKVSGIVLHSPTQQLLGTQPADDLVKKLNAELNQPITLELNLAAKGFAQLKRPKINLLPWEVKKAEEGRQQITYFLFSVLGLSFFMLFLFFLLYLGSFMINRQIDAVKSELDKPTEEFVQLREIEDKTNEIKNLLMGRKRIAEKSHDFPWDDLFNELNRIVPANVYLTRVEVNQEEAVIISGVAASSDYIFDFVRKLKEAKHFKNVDLKVIKEAEFSIYAEKK